MLRKFLIVGFDPGTTVGVSIIDFYGNVVDVFSFRNVSISDVIVKILDYGFPVIVSTDKKSIPKNVKFLSSKLNLKVVNPKFDLKYDFKKKIVNNFFNNKKNNKVVFSNSHEFDSFSAAVFAFNKFKSLFLKLEKNIVDIKDEDVFSFVLEVFSGKNIFSVKKSFLDLYSFEDNIVESKVVENTAVSNVVRDKNVFSEEFEVLKSKYDFLLKQNYFLKRRVYFNNKKLFYFKSLVNILSKDVKNNLKKENEVFNKLFLLEKKFEDLNFKKSFFEKNISFIDGFVFEDFVFLKQKNNDKDKENDEHKRKIVDKKFFDFDFFGFKPFRLEKDNEKRIDKSNNKNNDFVEFDFEEFINDYKTIRKKYFKNKIFKDYK